MNTYKATHVKTNFGHIMDEAQVSPVLVEKNGRPYVYILSKKEYDILQAKEDLYWIQQAIKGAKSGFLGVEESKKFLDSIGKNDVKNRRVKRSSKIYKKKTVQTRKTNKR